MFSMAVGGSSAIVFGDTGVSSNIQFQNSPELHYAAADTATEVAANMNYLLEGILPLGIQVVSVVANGTVTTGSVSSGTFSAAMSSAAAGTVVGSPVSIDISTTPFGGDITFSLTPTNFVITGSNNVFLTIGFDATGNGSSEAVMTLNSLVATCRW